jgi:hypothetical protein
MNLFRLFQKAHPDEHKIRYVVKGSADDYNVTYKFSDGTEVVQEPHVRKGWKHLFKGRRGDYIYISAQSNKPQSEVDVFVYEDGKLVDKLVKKGDYPIVQVSDKVH